MSSAGYSLYILNVSVLFLPEAQFFVTSKHYSPVFCTIFSLRSFPRHLPQAGILYGNIGLLGGGLSFFSKTLFLQREGISGFLTLLPI
jgi:hypothetical protein